MFYRPSIILRAIRVGIIRHVIWLLVNRLHYCGHIPPCPVWVPPVIPGPVRVPYAIAVGRRPVPPVPAPAITAPAPVMPVAIIPVPVMHAPVARGPAPVSPVAVAPVHSRPAVARLHYPMPRAARPDTGSPGLNTTRTTRLNTTAWLNTATRLNAATPRQAGTRLLASADDTGAAGFHGSWPARLNATASGCLDAPSAVFHTSATSSPGASATPASASTGLRKRHEREDKGDHQHQDYSHN